MFKTGDRIQNLMHSCRRKFCIGTITKITDKDFEVTYDKEDFFGKTTETYDIIYLNYIEKVSD